MASRCCGRGRRPHAQVARPAGELRRACIAPVAHPSRRAFRAGRAAKQGWRPSCRAALQVAGKEYITFTNPQGAVLQEIAEDVYAADRPFIWNGIDVGGRMAVLRLSGRRLLIHSPVALTSDLKEALAELGDVKYIVTPNTEHVKYAQQWMEAYPDAHGYACPGLLERMPGAGYRGEVGRNDAAPAEWADEVEATWLSYERNPFNGKPFFNEVVFLFKPARLFLTTDLFWAYPREGTAVGTQLWKFGMDRVYLPFYRTFMIKDKGSYEDKMRRIFDAWQWDSILPCHGDYIPSNGKAILRKHLKI